ncbi:rhodanese-like domain-containing protein [Desulfuribacillus alkaliarsenatis]|uniref:Rhodanese domain-containing protein n=1 Tax=Desulfuribacillus alkaliarsenatis TaxID=766136 RepID=A0A1E5FZB8_9FIRM|nr:rhodanese-like domain-containing protein [Desulfuribacillus alkaliarsenatis]OEF95926.1 hypothetical protein BHF68_11085 [Desulfuribacillus alkaliarsenatis]
MQKNLLRLFPLLLVGLLAISLALIGCSSESKTEYQYISAAELKNKLDAGEDVIIVDIQVEEEFNRHFIKGAIPTYAFPVETAEDRAKLVSTLQEIKTSNAPVIIVCPRGGGGATRTYDYYKGEFVSEDRLFILADGQEQWPYNNLLGSIDNTEDIKQKSESVQIFQPKEAIIQYVSPEQVKSDIENDTDILLIDIQPENDFRKHHIQGSIATYAFPVTSNDDKQKLARILPDVLTSEAPVYVLCPRGRSGAENTLNFLAEQGVDPNRMFIIEGGQAGWPYEELVVTQ